MKHSHMNLFDHYSQSGTLPIENNISRGLAILFRENRSFFLLFLSLLREKLQKKAENSSTEIQVIKDPYDAYDVGFQTPADEFDFVSQVIGVTLTSTDLPVSDESSDLSVDGKKITDIAIAYDDTLIIIEVKRNSVDCNKQICEQIENYIKSQRLPLEKSDKIPYEVLNMEWPDIVQLLGRDIRLNQRIDLLENDYKDFLLMNFPDWARSECLNRLSDSETDQINARLKTFLDKYIKYHNEKGDTKDNTQFYKDNDAVNISNLYDYVQLVRFWCVRQADCADPKTVVTINMWPGDTVGQSRSLRWNINKEFFNKRKQTETFDTHTAIIRIIPYIKFSAFRSSGLVWLNQKKNMDDNKIEAWLQLAEKISRQIKNNCWDQDLKMVIKKNQDLFDSADIEAFERAFAYYFEAPRCAQANVSCGFEVSIRFDFDSIKKLDSTDNDDSNDGLLKLIDKTVLNIASKMVIQKNN